MNNLVSQQYSILNKENTNELIYDIQSLTAQFTVRVLTTGLRLATDLTICFAIIALAYQNIMVFSLLLTATFLFVLFYKIVSNRVTSYGKLHNEASDELLKAVSETVKGFKELRILGKQLFSE